MRKTLLRVSFAAGLLAVTVFGWPVGEYSVCPYKCSKQECHECCVKVKQEMMEGCRCLFGPEQNECLKRVTEGFVKCVESCKTEKCEKECK